MKAVRLALLGLALAFAVPCLGAEPAVQDNAAEFGEYAEMVKTVRPAGEQSARLKEKIAARRKALDDFMKENGPAWQAAAKVMPNGQLNPAALEFQRKYDDAAAAQEAQVMSVLTPAQRLAWERESLFRRMVRQFIRVEVGHDPSGQMAARSTPLSDAQQRIIRKLTDDAAAGIQSLKDPYDPKARAESVARLVERITVELAKAGGGPAGPGELE